MDDAAPVRSCTDPTHQHDQDSDAPIPWPQTFWVCPGDGCDFEQWVAPDDPDAAFDEMLNHIHLVHPEIDPDPDTLWPRIRTVER